ncbi:MAG: M67 family metallopeptidase [Chloroflexi bacterium]|nr:M67 family metallopeptidase [Chloroflexota bacterium]
MYFQQLSISRLHWDKMQAHVAHNYPIEACGLLAGVNTKVFSVFPVTNSLNSQTRYRMDAQEQLSIFLTIEKRNWDLLGIYHSHPNGPPYPSRTDIDEAYYPGVAQLIWVLNDQIWTCHAFHIYDCKVSQIELIIE